MNEIALHPNVYATGASKGLVGMLERVWVREQAPGDGTMFVVSGFGNYNGGVRFYDTFRHHVGQGGKLVAVFAGSTSSRLTSRQVVSEMIRCGADVSVINRKRLMHAKCYGSRTSTGDSVIVTSGNFTGPGMSQNVEMSALLEPQTTAEMGFDWPALVSGVLSQRWDYYKPPLGDLAHPGWQLLYDEQATDIVLEESDELTMLLRLSHADTARINAAPGSDASKGTQYFWLSKDCYAFFPPLTIRNRRGTKATYSAVIQMNFINLGLVTAARVTFEAENNLDFRLGSGPLRGTGLAQEGDLAAISRVGEEEFELRLFRQGSSEYAALAPYTVHIIGNRGKQYGYASNEDFGRLIGVAIGGRPRQQSNGTRRMM